MVLWLVRCTSHLKVSGLRTGLGHHVVSLDKKLFHPAGSSNTLCCFILQNRG